MMEYNNKGLYISNRERDSSKSQTNLNQNVSKPSRNYSSSKISAYLNDHSNHNSNNFSIDGYNNKTNPNDSKNISIRMKINNINFKNTNEFFKRHAKNSKEKNKYDRYSNVNEKSNVNLEENIGGVISKIKNELDDISKHIRTSEEKMVSIKEFKNSPIKINNLLSARTLEKSPKLVKSQLTKKRSDSKSSSNVILDNLRNKNKSLVNELNDIREKFLDIKINNNIKKNPVNPPLDNRTYAQDGETYDKSYLKSNRPIKNKIYSALTKEGLIESDSSSKYKDKITDYENIIQELKEFNKNNKKVIANLKFNLNNFIPEDLKEENYEIVHSYKCPYETSKWYLISSKNQIKSYWILEEYLLENNFDLTQYEGRISLDEIELKYEANILESSKIQHDVINLKTQFISELKLKEQQLLETKSELEKINSKSLLTVDTVNKLNSVCRELKIENKELKLEVKEKSTLLTTCEAKFKDINDKLEFYIEEYNKIKKTNESLLTEKEKAADVNELKDKLLKLGSSYTISVEHCEKNMKENIKLIEIVNKKSFEIQELNLQIEEISKSNKYLQDVNNENKNLFKMITEELNKYKEEIENLKNDLINTQENLSSEQKKNKHLTEEISVLHQQIDNIPYIINEEINKYKNNINKTLQNGLDDKMKKMKDKLEYSLLEKTSIQDKLNILSEENIKLSEKNRELLKNLVEYDTNYKALERQGTEAEEKNKEHLLKIEILNKRIIKLNEIISEETKIKTDLLKIKSTMENSVRDLKAEIIKLKAIQEIEHSFKANLKVIKAIDINYLKIEVKSVKEDTLEEIPELMNKINLFTERIEKRDEKEKFLTAQIHSLKQENSKILNDLKITFEETENSLKDQIEKEKTICVEKENAIKELKDKLEYYTEQYETIEKLYNAQINLEKEKEERELESLNNMSNKIETISKENELKKIQANEELLKVKEQYKKELKKSIEEKVIFQKHIVVKDNIISEINGKNTELSELVKSLENKVQEKEETLNSTLNKYMEKEKEFKIQLESLSEEIKVLKNKSSESELDRTSLTEHNKKINLKLEDLYLNLIAKGKAEESLTSQLNLLQEENNNKGKLLEGTLQQTSQLTSLKNELLDKISSFDEIKKENDLKFLSLNVEIKKKDHLITNLNNQIAKSNERTKEEVNELYSRIDILTEQLKLRENAELDLNNIINKLVNDQRTVIQNHKEELTALEKRIKSLKSENDFMKEKENILSEQLNKIKSENENYKEIIQSLNKEDSKNKIIEVNRKLEKTIKEFEELKSKHVSTLQQKDNKIAENEIKIEELENLLKNKQQEIWENQINNSETEIRIEKLNEENSFLQEEITKLKSQYNIKKMKIKDLNDELLKENENTFNQLKVSQNNIQNNLLKSADLRVSNNFEVNFTNSSVIPDELQTKIIEIEIIKEELQKKDNELLKYKEDFIILQLQLKDSTESIEEKEKDIENYKKINDTLLEKINSFNEQTTFTFDNNTDLEKNQTCTVKTIQTAANHEEQEDEIANYKFQIEHLKEFLFEKDNELKKLSKENGNYKTEIDRILKMAENDDVKSRKSFDTSIIEEDPKIKERFEKYKNALNNYKNDNKTLLNQMCLLKAEIRNYKDKYTSLLNYEGRIENYELFIQSVNKVLENYKPKNKENEEVVKRIKYHMSINHDLTSNSEKSESNEKPITGDKQENKKGFFSGLFSSNKTKK